jgi:hypothetical protein
MIFFYKPLIRSNILAIKSDNLRLFLNRFVFIKTVKLNFELFGNFLFLLLFFKFVPQRPKTWPIRKILDIYVAIKQVKIVNKQAQLYFDRFFFLSIKHLR